MAMNISTTQALLILIQQNQEVLKNVLSFQGALEEAAINRQDNQEVIVELEKRLNILVQRIQRSRDVLLDLL